jgi:hypothetical protein
MAGVEGQLGPPEYPQVLVTECGFCATAGVENAANPSSSVAIKHMNGTVSNRGGHSEPIGDRLRGAPVSSALLAVLLKSSSNETVGQSPDRISTLALIAAPYTSLTSDHVSGRSAFHGRIRDACTTHPRSFSWQSLRARFTPSSKSMSFSSSD